MLSALLVLLLIDGATEDLHAPSISRYLYHRWNVSTHRWCIAILHADSACVMLRSLTLSIFVSKSRFSQYD